MFGLLSLGFTLSLDNFRSSLVLGGPQADLRAVGQDIRDLRAVGRRRTG